MRRILVCLFILFAALSVKAQGVSGIRIDGGDSPILVYFGGNQMCSPSSSCFVANLKPGYYQVEVYASRPTPPRGRIWKGPKLYSERIYFNGSGVQDIYVGTPDYDRPGNRPNHGGGHSDTNRDDNVMDASLFDSFYKTVKNEISSSSRIKAIDSVLGTSYFTCAQCLRLTELFVFENDRMTVMKKMYPYLVDKQGFFNVIGSLTFSSNKDAMNQFVKNYNNSLR